MTTQLQDPEIDPQRDPEPEPEPEPALEPELVDEQPAEQALARAATDLVSRAKAFAITDPSTFEIAGQMLETLKAKKRQIVEFFEGDIARAHAAWKGLTSKRAGFVDPIDEAVAALSARYGAFAKEARDAAERERKRLEREALEREQARLKEEADRLSAEAAVVETAALAAPSRAEAQQLEAAAEELKTTAAEVRQQATTAQAPVFQARPTVTTPKGTSIKENWSHAVTDLMQLVKAVAAGTVSREALLPNDSYLRARAKADKDTVQIPGVRFYDAISVSHRSRRS